MNNVVKPKLTRERKQTFCYKVQFYCRRLFIQASFHSRPTNIPCSPCGILLRRGMLHTGPAAMSAQSRTTTREIPAGFSREWSAISPTNHASSSFAPFAFGTMTGSSQKLRLLAYHFCNSPVFRSMRTYPSGGPLTRTSLLNEAYTYRHARLPSNNGDTCGWSMHKSSQPGAG